VSADNGPAVIVHLTLYDAGGLRVLLEREIGTVEAYRRRAGADLASTATYLNQLRACLAAAEAGIAGAIKGGR